MVQRPFGDQPSPRIGKLGQQTFGGKLLAEALDGLLADSNSRTLAHALLVWARMNEKGRLPRSSWEPRNVTDNGRLGQPGRRPGQMLYSKPLSGVAGERRVAGETTRGHHQTHAPAAKGSG